ncbi:MAG: UDP-N-acetylglucosamine 2-epimerase (non-hydrolyzing) [Zavarzinella sp.]
MRTARTPNDSHAHVMVVFGTRPETIKVAPVIRQLQLHSNIQTTVAFTGQHRNLVEPLLKLFKIDVNITLDVMKPNQPLNGLLANVLHTIDPVLAEHSPDLVLVQGDTTTALGGALAAFHRKIAVGHIEAGLRTSDPRVPFPEETNRRLISQVAELHFAATGDNRRRLLKEGIPPAGVFQTGNPVVDALQQIGTTVNPSDKTQTLIDKTAQYRRIVLTTHRRESMGDVMEGNLKVLADFVERNHEAALIFAVHPNPNVKECAQRILGNRPRIHLVEPLDYADFIHVLKHSWLICSDSGGIQEEAPSLGKRVIVLRNETERPEAIESGFATLAGDPAIFAEKLAAIYPHADRVPPAKDNPFGSGDAAQRIVEAIQAWWQAGKTAPTGAVYAS